MIISRTPFRVSFFGGGTDYPVFYQEEGGAVLATTIDKYCYITCRYLPPFFEHKTRVLYSKIENVKANEEIEHPAVRGVLQYLKMEHGVEIHHDGDVPARTGLGSSSAFTVGLLHALYALKQQMPTQIQLAREAIKIEQEILKESVGCQDQVLAAYGGFCRVDFTPNHDIHVTPIILSQDRLENFQNHLLLYFTGFSRYASEIAKEQIQFTRQRKTELKAMYEMVKEGVSILTDGSDLTGFGELLHESWKLKRSLTAKISSPTIDEIYKTARRAGAIGGKLLGAGGGGFLLLFVKPDDQPLVREALRSLLRVPFSFETRGSQIIFYQPDTLLHRDYPLEFQVREEAPIEELPIDSVGSGESGPA